MQGRRRHIAVALVLALLGIAGPVWAQTFSLTSQNTLHLGWGQQNYQNAKYNYFNGNFAAYDVIAMQEVMTQVNAGLITPGNHTWYLSALKGSSNYQESYAFLVKNPGAGGFNVAGNAIIDYPDLANNFSRPPSGILVQSGMNWTWIIDYHAIFGKRKSQRQTEVANVAQVFTYYSARLVSGVAYPRVIVAGDWNLPAADAAFVAACQAVGAGCRVEPIAQSSLKRNGGLSQPYDHFLWNNANTTLVNTMVIDPPTGTNRAFFRSNYSDHLGISADVQY